MSTAAVTATLRKQANERVRKQLDSMWSVFGPLDRDELVAVMDGAQDAVMEWMPPNLQPKGRLTVEPAPWNPDW